MNEMLLVSHVSKKYGGGGLAVHAVDDVSFQVKSGEFVVLMGPSGSGKTTLLLMCGGLLSPDTGRVVVDGDEISAMEEDRLPLLRLSKIGFVFQQFNLLEEFTAAENVEVVLNARGVDGDEAKRRTTEVLRSVGMLARSRHLPSQLSGGEKQRIAIGRALANNPRLILADEPTGNLDSKSGAEVVQLMRNLATAKEVAVVVATHDSRIVGIADRVMQLEDGRLKEH